MSWLPSRAMSRSLRRIAWHRHHSSGTTEEITMMRRRAVGVRRGPGIVGTMARTAVVAGTATVTAKAVGGAMDSHAQAQQAQADQQVAQPQQMQPQQMPSPPAGYPAPAADLTSQLQQLAQLKESGVLSDAEFQAAKA